MKPFVILAPFAVLTIGLAYIPTPQGDWSVIEPALRGLAELPLVAGAVWFVLRFTDKQHQTTSDLITHFENRAERKDQQYQAIIKEHLDTIRDLAKTRQT